MAIGYLVTLGDGTLDSGDGISANQSAFTSSDVIGTGSWTCDGSCCCCGRRSARGQSTFRAACSLRTRNNNATEAGRSLRERRQKGQDAPVEVRSRDHRLGVTSPDQISNRKDRST